MQNAPREHYAILSAFIKLPIIFKAFVLSIFVWPLKTGFTFYTGFTVIVNMMLSYLVHNSLGDFGTLFVHLSGCVAQSVRCLATDASLTADPGVASLIPARSHTFVKIDFEIISTVILRPSAESIKKDCCQLQAKVCAQNTG